MNDNRENMLLRFLRWFCPASLYEGVEGDLLEQFEADTEVFGERKARWLLRWNVLRFFRPGIILRNSFSKGLINTIMLRSYFKIAVRNIMKRKLYASINALGLSLGIAACILIYLFIQDERSFDQFHANKGLIYRMQGEMYDQNAPELYYRHCYMSLALAQTLKDEVPEVQYATHFVQRTDFFRHEETIFKSKFAYVGKDFFDMFSFDMIEGGAGNLFGSKEELVLTASAATKYFGSKDPIGKVMQIGANGDKLFKVAAIIQNPPANSSLDFEMLLPVESMNGFNEHNLTHWLNQGFPTFIQLYPEASAAEMAPKLQLIVEKYMSSEMTDWGQHLNAPEGTEIYELSFGKLTDMHFQKEIGCDKVSDPQYSYVLGGIALLILVIACINYISLAMTSSASRRKEVGVRKVTGAHKRQLVAQFTFESVFLTFLAMLFGLGLVFLFLPVFNELTGKAISVSTADWLPLIGFSLATTLLIGLLAGSYPAFFLSGLLPTLALKNGVASGAKTYLLRPLVVLQFVLSSFLMISSVVMYRQMDFITSKDLGFNQEQVVVIPTHGSWNDNESNKILERFRQAATQHPEVLSVAGSANPVAFGEDYMVFGGYKVDGVPRTAFGFLVDEHFVPTMELQIVQGRNFDAAMMSDAEESIIVNEALVKELGWTDPLNERMNFHASQPNAPGARVIGVVKDFNFLSLKDEIKPMFLYEGRDLNMGYIVTRLAPGDVKTTLAQLEGDFAEAAPGKPFEYTFLDEKIERQYAQYKRWMDIMLIATCLAVVIAGLGLFGLAGINAVNKTKEIGIRKVLGARVAQVFMLLNKQYIGFALIAFILAAPLSWYAMSEWLSGFAYAIEINWQVFATSMALGVLIALTAVSYHALKASALNPADSLRYE
tara:strand:+ start:17717 stop:20377 length:2661 start_codon:yes stop_codon:yes gene_type:complete